MSQHLLPVYRAVPEVRPQVRPQRSDVVRVSLRADHLPVRQLIAELAGQTGVSIVVSAELQEAAVSGHWPDHDLRSVLSFVARSLNAELAERDNGRLFYIGSAKSEDCSLLVRRVLRVDVDDVPKAVQGVLADGGKVAVLPDGICIVSDKFDVLMQVHQLFDQIERAPSVVWCVQYHIVSFSDRDLHDFGLDVQPALQLAAGFANLHNLSASITRGVIDGVAGQGGDNLADASLSAVLRAARERAGMSVVSDPLLICVDGHESRVVKGSSVPVLQTLVNGQTGQSQTSVTWVQTGLNLVSKVREVSPSSARLSVELKISDVTGNQNGAPVTDNQELITSSIVETGGVYLVGSIRRSETRQSRGAFFTWGLKHESKDETWLVFAKCYRIEKGISDVRAEDLQ